MTEAIEKSPLQTAEESRTIAEHKLATVYAELESKALENSRSLIESPQPVTPPWGEYPAFDEFSRYPSSAMPYVWSDRDDRTEGRYRPLYDTEQDLRRMRASGRRLKALFPIAESALEALTNYVMKGLQFTVQPKNKAHKDDPNIKQLAAVVQSVLDDFLEYNSFADDLDREIHKESREVGESCMALYPDDKNVRIDLIPPDCILQPAQPQPIERALGVSHKLNYWWHGVHTQYCNKRKQDDVAKPLGYHLVFDRTGDQWDYLPASRVELIKRNVGRDSRRGWGDFEIVLQDAEHEGRIKKNTAIGTATLAAIVMIREHAEGASKSSIEKLVREGSTGNYRKLLDNGSSRTTYGETVKPGTVKDTPHGMKSTVGPLGTLRSPVYLEVAQYLLRAFWQRWNAPEYMSGDASNANLASTLVAESPFVRAREADQNFYGKRFVRMLWKALALLKMKCGKLPGVSWEQIRSLLTIEAKFASPSSRDKYQQAQTNEILYLNKVISKQSWQIDSDLDPEQENAAIAVEPPPPTPLTAVPGGLHPGHGQTETQRIESLASRALARLLE